MKVLSVYFESLAVGARTFFDSINTWECFAAYQSYNPLSWLFLTITEFNLLSIDIYV